MGSVATPYLKQVIWVWMDGPNEPIQEGWALCNGQTLSSANQDINPGSSYTLPNLLNCYPIGADPTKSAGAAPAAVGSGNIDAAAGAPGPAYIGGSNQNTLSNNELPSHSHNVASSSINHHHSWYYTFDSEASGVGVPVPTPRPPGQSGALSQDTSTVTANVSLNLTNTGGGNPHDNRPRSVGLVPLMRVKY